MNNGFIIVGLQKDGTGSSEMSGQDIDLSEIPEITEEQMKRAVLRVDGKPVAKGKVRVNMFLDADIVAYFKSLSGGRGYQTLINETLRKSILADDLETVLRRVIREELHTYSPTSE